MDYDVIMNMSDTHGEASYSYSRSHLTHEIILTLFFVVGMIADFAIFYTILRYNRIRTIPNMFLVNWTIADFLCLLITPSAYGIISVIGQHSLSHNFLCLLEEFGSTLHITVLIFICVALIDWFLASYFGSTSEKFRSNYIVIVGGVWIFAIIYSSTFTGMCLHYKSGFYHQGVTIPLSYFAAAFLVIVFQISRAVQKCRGKSSDYSTTVLTLATSYVIMSLLSFLNVVFMIAFRSYPGIAIFSIICLFCSSLVNLLLLFFFDKDFHACFLQAIKRQSDRYETSISYFDNPIRITNGTRSSNNLHGSQELLTNVE